MGLEKEEQSTLQTSDVGGNFFALAALGGVLLFGGGVGSAAVLCGSGARVAVPKELVKALEKAAAGKAETAGMVRDALKKYVPKAPEPES